MKAIRFHRYGGPEVLTLADVEAPHAGPGQVRIVVRGSGVNPSDWKRRQGLFEEVTFPAGVGVEASGVVDEIGPGVTGVALGDAVFGFGIDTAAERAILFSWAIKPDNVPFEVAAGLPVISDTATRALDEVGIRPGQTLLVSGAAGGIGSATVQLARLSGIAVIGTASAAKHAYLRDLGALPTTYGPGLKERVGALAPEGIDAALDIAGSGVIAELIDIVGNPSHVLSVADFSAEAQGAKFSHGPPKEPQRIFTHIARLCAEGRFRLHIDRTFALEETAEAHRLSAEGRVTGKLVICPDTRLR